MAEKTYITLTGANTYHYGGVRFERDVPVAVSEDLADYLLEQRDTRDAGYFKLLREKDLKGASVKEVSTVKAVDDGDDDADDKNERKPAATKTATKKAAKKTTVRVSGGKIEGLDTPVNGDDDGGSTGEAGGEGDGGDGRGASVTV